MLKAQMLAEELNHITNPKVRATTEAYLEEATPDYFFSVSASLSGQHHPLFALGVGGLVRHTKAVCMIAEELMRMKTWMYLPDLYKDFIRAACIVHDTCKYGAEDEIDKSKYREHPDLAAENYRSFWNLYNDGEECPQFLLNAIAAHMGQWGETKEMTPMDRCVHFADYFSSRDFISIPTLEV